MAVLEVGVSFLKITEIAWEVHEVSDEHMFQRFFFRKRTENWLVKYNYYESIIIAISIVVFSVHR